MSRRCAPPRPPRCRCVAAVLLLVHSRLVKAVALKCCAPRGRLPTHLHLFH